MLNSTTNRAEIIGKFNELEAGGGGDEPEAVYSGLMAALSQPSPYFSWRNDAERMIFLIGDAAPHDPEPVTGYTLATVVNAARSNSAGVINIYPIQVTTSTGTSSRGTQNPAGPPNSTDQTPNSSLNSAVTTIDVGTAFQQLADQTFGQKFDAPNVSAIVPAIVSAIYWQVQPPLASVGLQPTVNYPVGASPQSVAIGDLNGDGMPDLATANETANTISILLNNGNGTFQAAVNSATIAQPYIIKIGDVNGDGKQDLVIASSINTVSVRLGNGNGTFQPAVNYTVGSTASSLALGDFNADAKLDIVVASDGSDSVNVLLGNGNGTFQAAVNYSQGSSPSSVVVGDVNGDTALDIAVAYANNDSIGILLGNGDGTFQPGMTYAVSRTPQGLAIGDINGDGKLDLAVVNAYTINDFAGVLLGNGDGTFQEPLNYTVGLTPSSVAMGDINGDGKIDLIVSNSGNDGGIYTISILLGLGGGAFSPSGSSYINGSVPRSVALIDLNGDGKLDVVTANEVSNNVSVLLQQVTVSPTPTPTATPTSSPTVLPTLTGSPTPASTGTATPTRTNTPTNTPTATTGTPTASSASPTATRTNTPTATSTPTPTSGATVTATPGSGSFQATSVLDSFNRANGAIGSAWVGDTTGYAIASNKLAADDAGRLNWNASFGADQEAYVTLSTIDPSATDIDLLLKGQDQGDCNVLEAWYQPSRGTVEVWTCDAANSWHQQGSAISVTFAAGDQFGARAHADGTVGVYRNGILLGSVTIGTNWSYRTAGGFTGVWLINASGAVLDDFGGGTLSSGGTATPTSTASATSTPSRTPTVTSTPTRTPTNTPIVTATSGPTLTPTRTATNTPTNTPTPTRTVTPTPTATPSGGGFPANSVLDTFNRANGAIGSAWVGDTSSYAIASNKLAVDDGFIYWNTSFGASQETYVTLSAIDIYASEIDLLLKGQDASDCNVLEVWYQPSRGTVQVWSCDETNGWHQQGSDISVTFAAGDRFGARAHADGTVDVYQNSTLRGSVTIGTNWEYRSAGGKIGVWLLNATSTLLDDFGGGTLSS